MAFDTRRIDTSSTRQVTVEMELECPLCHKSGNPEYASGCIVKSFNNDEKPMIFTVWYCTSCKQYYVSMYHMMTNLQDTKLDASYPYPKNYDENTIPYYIKEKYPNFSKIYSESCECERMGLNRVAGTGYRKALEFLIKDYLQNEQGLSENDVKDCRLETCCKKIELEDISNLANAATWLGNDETHYTVKHPEYDLTHLKSFLNALISSIHNKHEVNKAKILLQK